jgi:polyhydroxyalkanoate synthesis repressor PhaR
MLLNAPPLSMACFILIWKALVLCTTVVLLVIAVQRSRQDAVSMSTKPIPINYHDMESAEAQDGEKKSTGKSIIIKKYANRRLYNTDTSTYVTLDDLAAMVRSECDFMVYDAKTGEDLTHSVLTQIIVEQESKGQQNLLPVGFLRQLIRFYGNSMQGLIPSYLEYSLDTLTREQEKYRKQFADAFGTAAFEAMQEQTRKNLAIFERALNMFAPFTAFDQRSDHSKPEAEQAAEPQPSQNSEIAELKAQLASIQTQLHKLADEKKS